MTPSSRDFDLAVVGAGIVGLSCALAAARRGLKVIVLDRSPRAQGASIRNFGFVTVTGQEAGAIWRRARRSRDVWQEIAGPAGIRVEQRGLWLAARRPESAAVLDAFMRTEMAEGCELLTPAAARRRCPELAPPGVTAVLSSSHELRVESREAIPRLAAWLAREFGVEFRWETAVTMASVPHLQTSRGAVSAAAVAVCPGDDLATLFQERLAAHGVARCALQMLRLESPDFTLPATVMADLSLIRYGGYANLPEAAALQRRLEAEQPQHLRHGIHLIVAQGADGSLVVGDSHHYDAGSEPFAEEVVYDLILDEFRSVFGRPAPAVRERWVGTYAVAQGRSVFIDAPSTGVRLVVVTSGIGASTGFAIGEEVIAELCT